LEKVRLTLSGVGGAFGGKEDLSVHPHACLLALHTGRPVKMVYNREESFFGHVHRHPFRLRYEHGATREGELVYVKARIVADGGAYASTSTAVIGNATCFACGPYKVPNAQLDGYVVYTNNPPCGAMRGFGAVQACFGYESQMDKLAEALGMDPVDLRLKNAMKTGDELPTGQKVEGPAPVAELLRRLRDMPLPDETRTEPLDLREVPGGVSNATHGEGVKRGVGYAVGLKNTCKSAGYDDYSMARVRLSVTPEGPLVEVHTAAAECGQGLVTIQEQIARTELGVEQVVLLQADTAVGSAGTSSASRQTYMTGGAVKAACEAVRERILRMASDETGEPVGELTFTGGNIVSGDRVVASLSELLDGDTVEETRVFRHRETEPLDPETGQGNAHVSYIFAAHRAVVDVDTELGLVRVVEIATTQDAGKAINPQAVEGQIEGGIAQGLGLALLEEIQVSEGKIQNASFTDYLIPTILDMPPVRSDILELGDPESPYGVKGVGEPPTVSSPPAIVTALRAATERELPRIPVKPEQIVGISEKPPSRPPQPGSRGPGSPTTIGR
jgi:CO/xanthine dehydrogenase Mo-binding subunit